MFIFIVTLTIKGTAKIMGGAGVENGIAVADALYTVDNKAFADGERAIQPVSLVVKAGLATNSSFGSLAKCTTMPWVLYRSSSSVWTYAEEPRPPERTRYDYC